MDSATRDLVRHRAENRCEYCGISQRHLANTLQIEHIVAKQHHGPDNEGNLALACDRCNAFKGTNLTAVDPETGNIVPLFHPRKDRWLDHFAMRGAFVVGLTDVGRATVRLLRMNAEARVELRSEIAEEGGGAE
jgi:hypothetical protein